MAKKKAAKRTAKKKTSSSNTSKKQSSKRASSSSKQTDGDEPAPRPLRKPKKDSLTGRYLFPGISPTAWEHPADRAGLTAMRKVPGFDLALKTIFRHIGDRSIRLAFLASSVRVTPRQFPKLHDLHVEVCRTLDADPIPELFVSQTPIVNAGAVGVGRPFIVLNSGSMALFDEDELRFLLGHELGHVLSGHVLYKTMLRILMRLLMPFAAVPLGAPAILAITAALLEWDRRSELSADRAGMLVAQDTEVALRVNMKLAGGGSTDQMNLREFLAQAEEYEAGGNVIDSVMKLLNILGQTHPFPVLRLADLKRWLDEGNFDRLISDGYPLREDDDAHTSLLEELMSGGDSYKSDLDESRDPLAKMVKDLARSLKNTSEGLFGSFWGEVDSDDDEPDEEE